MSISADTFNLRCMAFNLCDTPAMDKDTDYDGLRITDRWKKITHVIQTLSPDVIGFQEVRGNTMAALWSELGPLGYRIKFQEGSPHDKTVCNAIAYKAAKLWPQTVTTWWNSDTPDKVSCSYGNGWPRAVLAVEFYPVKQVEVIRYKQESGNKETFSRPDPDLSAAPLLIVNSHLGLGVGPSHPKERLFSNQTTIEKIKSLVGSRRMFVLSIGDFNSFKDGKYYAEEMGAYTQKGFVDAVTSTQLVNQNNVPISGPWVGFSPDKKFKCGDDRFGSALMHMWHKAFNLDDSWSVKIAKCFASTLTGDKAIDERDVKSEAELLKGPTGSSLRDKYPSDHLALVLDFSLRAVKKIEKKSVHPLLKGALAIAAACIIAKFVTNIKK